MSHFENVIIRASAGTGKTFQLSNRFISLLHANVPVDEILATTFTRKAAAEILDRVIVRLADAALDKSACDELAAFVGGKRLTTRRCQTLLGELTHNLHRMHVCTLDSFFAQLAGSFSLEAGLPPGWRIVDEMDEARLRDEAIALTLRERSLADISRLVLLMSKGEASRSVGELVRTTVSRLYDVYMVTPHKAWQKFSPPAALSPAELHETIDELRHMELAAASLAKARDKDVTAAESDDWEAFIKGGITAKIIAGESKYSRVEIPAAVIALYERLLQQVRAVLISQIAKQTDATYELLNRFADCYRLSKEDARAMRFADVTRTLAEATSRDSESAGGVVLGGQQQVAFRLDSRISHLLLDEFQDTSLEQWRVLRPFAQHAAGSTDDLPAPAGSQPSSLFCVGDVKQAIYGWRGGIAEIFNAMQSEIPGLVEQNLNQSFRSSTPVIETVNKVFSNLTAHKKLAEASPALRAWQRQFIPHTTAKEDLPGYVELRAAPAPEPEETKDQALIGFASQKVAELAAQSPGSTIGVLARSNDFVAAMIYALRQRGVFASEEGGNPLTDSPAVETILALLTLADHPGDTVAQAQIACSPLGPIVGFTQPKHSVDAVRVARRVRRDLQTEGFGPTIAAWAEQLAPHCNERDYNRLLQLVELAYQYSLDQGLRTKRFVESVQERRIADPTTARVRVMTIHQAKGLEFDVVVLADLGKQLVGQPGSYVVGRPTPTAPIDRVCVYRNSDIQAILPVSLQRVFRHAVDQTMTEALCVLYVAITRAIHSLYMIVPDSGKPTHQTFAGLLQTTLADASAGKDKTLLYACGDPHWLGPGLAPAPPVAETEEEMPAMPQIRLAAMPERMIGLGRTSPSERAHGPRRRVADVLKVETATAKSRGTIIHAWFQLIQWLDDGRPDRETLESATRGLDTRGLNLTTLAGQFESMLDKPEVNRLLHRAAYQPPHDAVLKKSLTPSLEARALRAEVFNERGFALRDGGQIVSGSIDRLVLLYDGDQVVAADVIDFKTDAAGDGEAGAVDNLVAKYSPQLDAYRTAVAKLFDLAPDRIATRLLFVGPGVVRDV